MSGSHPTPLRRRPSANDDLAQSMRHLSLSTGTPAKPSAPRASSGTRSPSVSSGGGRAGSAYRSPSVASSRGPAVSPRSPLFGGGRESRAGAATPTLLRKASLNSLHGGSGGAAASTTPLRRGSSATLRSASCSPAPSQRRSPLLGVAGGSGSGSGSGNGNGFFEPLYEEPTAEDIAQQHFEDELMRHVADMHQPPADRGGADTVVVLQDSCYGHRFSRPRTSRANLATIVERPERLQACVVGVSAAYVRLGGRHADGAHMPHPRRRGGAIATVPFHIRKTTRQLPLQSAAVTNVHGAKWMEELQAMCDAAEAKLALNGRELQRPDMGGGGGDGGDGSGGSADKQSDGTTPPRLHEGDLYLCGESLDALQGALGGVCEAVDAVFEGTTPTPAAGQGGGGGGGRGPRRAFVGIRPPGHHCSATWPSGFCWINNVHVGIMHAMLAHGLTHAAIVDFDLHHGDGSQAVAWQHNARGAGLGQRSTAAAWKKASIGYFSLHDINSFPCEYGDGEKVKNASVCIENAHGQNVWNVHLEPWKTEAEFWQLYETKYVVLLDKVRAFLRGQTALREQGLLDQHGAAAGAGAGAGQTGQTGQPRAAIFISAGFDASEWETSSMQRHKVNVPTAFYARFTRDIVRLADEEGTSADGRVISVLEGGYSDRALFSGVLSHLSGLAGSDPEPVRDDAYHRGLGYQMGRQMEEDECYEEREPVRPAATPYEATWWAPAELDRIEAIIAPPPPPPPPGKAGQAQHPSPSYYSPTTSSKAKAATPRVRRSASGLSAMYNRAASPMSRPPTPPPPEVSWTVAMHELSKLLIPSDRTTGSCTAEELSPETTSRARRDRQATTGGGSSVSSLSAPSTPGAPTRVSQRERRPVKPFGMINEEQEEERKSRRKTLGGEKLPTTVRGRPKQTGRRLSVASEVGVPASSSTAASRGSARPTSAQSSAPSGPLNVRKTRPATAMGVSTTGTARRNTSAQMPTMPRKTSATDGTEKAATAGGGRRIKINVVTTAQKEARDKARLGGGGGESQNGLPALRLTEASQTSASPSTDESPLLTPSTEATEADSHGSSTSAAVSKPPGSTTPTAMRRADLPAFTATSAIPFARPAGEGGRP